MSMASPNEQQLSILAQITQRDVDQLLPLEIFWREAYSWLKESGYLLRPRYSPDWTAPWIKTGGDRSEFEEGALMISPEVMDATRMSDGAYVILKRSEGSVDAPSQEISIFRKLFAEPLASNPENHCVPALDFLRVPDEIEKNMALIVMPKLFLYQHYPFSTIGEVVQFLFCIFEGLKFMHSHNIWHGDCKYDNILMDASPILRDDPHPWKRFKTRDYKPILPARSRTKHPIKYYWIDFDVSGEYDPSQGPPLTDPGYGGNRNVPEWAHLEEQCNPFAVDVWCLGDLLRGQFINGNQVYPPHKVSGLEFMKELVADMCQEDPTKRPTMDVVLARFSRLTADLSEFKLRSRFRWKRPRSPVQEVLDLAQHWAQQVYFAAGRIPAIPAS
ncbi:kinase-like domain-containing protein, partial [Mycena filopes]